MTCSVGWSSIGISCQMGTPSDHPSDGQGCSNSKRPPGHNGLMILRDFLQEAWGFCVIPPKKKNGFVASVPPSKLWQTKMFSSTWSNDGTIWPVGTRRSSCDFGLFLVSSKNLQTRRPPLKVITIQSISTRYQIEKKNIYNIDRYQWYMCIYIIHYI